MRSAEFEGINLLAFVRGFAVAKASCFFRGISGGCGRHGSGCVCWRKGCMPAAGCVAERGVERSFHSL
jgi:hypothetical protein